MNDEKINAIRDRSDRLSDDNAKLVKENHGLKNKNSILSTMNNDLIDRLFEAYWRIHKPEIREKAARLWAFKSLTSSGFIPNKFYLLEAAFIAPIKELDK